VPSLTTLLLFAAATLALIVTPGAGVVYLITQTIDRGRSAGVASMFGIEAADLTHMLLAVLGVSALLAASELTYDAVRYLGATYLIGIGIYKLFFERPEPLKATKPKRHHRLVAQGYLVQILNPKPALFFAAFLPQFIDPEDAIVTQMLVLSLTYLVIAMACDFAYVLMAGAVGSRLAKPGESQLISRISGITYIALGVLAALVGARPAKAVT
jgi:threonine/homoserine/homoserine lactone efflux protein